MRCFPWTQPTRRGFLNLTVGKLMRFVLHAIEWARRTRLNLQEMAVLKALWVNRCIALK